MGIRANGLCFVRFPRGARTCYSTEVTPAASPEIARAFASTLGAVRPAQGSPSSNSVHVVAAKAELRPLDRHGQQVSLLGVEVVTRNASNLSIGQYDRVR